MKSKFLTQMIGAFAFATNGVVTLVGVLFAAALVLCSGFAIYDTLYIEQSAKAGWKTMQYRPDVIDDPNAQLTPSELAALNSDYRAWITVYDTNIDYPVMQGADDLYYASHDVYKDTSLSGSIYLAAANSPDFSDNYNLLYGHHMDNGAMFGDLDKFMETGFFDTHREAVLVTETEVYDLYIFALIETDAYEQAIYAAGNKDLSEVLAYAAGHYVQYDTSVAVGEKIIALSTCASSSTDGRLVLLATFTPRTTPDTPVTPAEPTQPESPTPAGPTQPDVPGGSDGTTPDSPDQPDGPIADMPDGPEQPTQPTQPGTTDGPEQPGTTDNPDQPGTPGNPTQPDNPASGTAADSEPSENPSTQGQTAPTATPSTPKGADKPASGRPFFEPRGNEGGLDNWALLNLISMLLTVWIVVPLGYLKDKFKRRRMLKQFEKELVEGREEDGQTIEPLDEGVARALASLVKSVVRKYRAGLVLEAIVAVFSVVFFFYVTDFRQPMVIVNRHTPPLLLALAVCWLVDRAFVRFCAIKKVKREEADHE